MFFLVVDTPWRARTMSIVFQSSGLLEFVVHC